MMIKKKYCRQPSDIPAGEHYAIIEFGSFWVEGDERSRTHPGHGYPGHTEQTTTYVLFESKADWESDIAERLSSQYQKKDFVPIVVRRPVIETVHRVIISS